MSARRQAVCALLAANLAFAGSFPFSVVALRGWSPVIVTALRFAIAAALLARIGVPVLRRASWQRRRRIAALASLGLWTQMVLIYEGIQASQAAIAAVIVGLEPVLIALWAALLLGERLTSKRAAGLSIGLIGALLVAGIGTDTPHVLGLVCLLGMGLCWGWYTVAGKALMSELTPVELISAVSVVGVVWAAGPAVISVVWFGGWSDPGHEQWVALIYLGVIQSVLAYSLWNWALVRLPAAMVGTSLYIQPIAGAGLSWLFLSETLPPTFIPGAVLVLAAVWIAGRPTTEPLQHQPEAVAAGVAGGQQPPVV